MNKQSRVLNNDHALVSPSGLFCGEPSYFFQANTLNLRLRRFEHLDIDLVWVKRSAGFLILVNVPGNEP